MTKNPKSNEFTEGMTAGLVWVSDVFELHQNAFIKRGIFKKKQIKLVLNIIDACIRRRETLADVGPKNLNLFISKDYSASLKEK